MTPPVLILSRGGIPPKPPLPPKAELLAIWFHLEPGLAGAWTESPLSGLERVRYGYPAEGNSRWLQPIPRPGRSQTAAAIALERLCYLRGIRAVILADPTLRALALSADRNLQQLRTIRVASTWPPAPTDWTSVVAEETEQTS